MRMADSAMSSGATLISSATFGHGDDSTANNWLEVPSECLHSKAGPEDCGVTKVDVVQEVRTKAGPGPCESSVMVGQLPYLPVVPNWMSCFAK